MVVMKSKTWKGFKIRDMETGQSLKWTTIMALPDILTVAILFSSHKTASLLLINRTQQRKWNVTPVITLHKTVSCKFPLARRLLTLSLVGLNEGDTWNCPFGKILKMM